jgi:hypothetical protein
VEQALVHGVVTLKESSRRSGRQAAGEFGEERGFGFEV